MSVSIYFGTSKHAVYAAEICALIEKAAQQRGTGIAKRDPEYIKNKFKNENAVIALDGKKLVGFCYIEIWENKKYVANSGLIVHPEYRNRGLAKQIKSKAFELSSKKYPGSKLFGITTSLAVMNINSELGYKPVTFSELTQDETFWVGCKSCPNYDILSRNDSKNCLCTGMLYNPQVQYKKPKAQEYVNMKKLYQWVQMKITLIHKGLKPLTFFKSFVKGIVNKA
ncbi:GNAT family N-acetyltransferase [Balneola vulgaris]|jgi:N-acetylglutamate synthase-like GNAT family acetyltransferase|uniref:GNAT family N-acetyltransferase n=1 Tax=Balneola vulgaris TaxID=287535 RepID=UPI0003681066|nr:GNAT family N-acetyltransferase [Balneola vulgaris]